ncbi:hypothetical protein V8J82_07930 [Gymnodinialimonas sp. 2305UL16-5]|uniref:hypothetical protein n=1 Tax=Gymnodinialimonas mytili TaxID=3126503 RepID=UPI00309D97E7
MKRIAFIAAVAATVAAPAFAAQTEEDGRSIFAPAFPAVESVEAPTPTLATRGADQSIEQVSGLLIFDASEDD